jgi:hypothetical protein
LVATSPRDTARRCLPTPGERSSADDAGRSLIEGRGGVRLRAVLAILRLITSEQGREAYDAVAAIVDIEHKHPLGLIMHGATEVNGKMQIAEVWDSREHARRFDEEHLWPAVEAAGVRRTAEITIFELLRLVTP